jgi:uncharacterized protein (TIGR02678 family)
MSGVHVQDTATDRARAVRILMASPLLDRRAGDDFALVVAHAEWLQRWFDEKCGWVLAVDARHGFARLRKVPARSHTRRGLRTARNNPRPFTRRRYSLFAVTAAVLSDVPRPQISLQDLVDRVRQVSTDTPGIAAFVASRRSERIALVDAITQLVALGVLAVVDARGDYVDSEAADFLYDIDDRRLGHLIAAPRPPSLSTSLGHMLHEDRYGPWVEGTAPAQEVVATDPQVQFTVRSLDRARELAGTGAPGVSEEQQRRRSRHRIMRMLLDDPVLYLHRLDPAERAYLQQTIGSFATWAEEAGMVLERRAEGWALIDPDDLATDVRFPEGNDLVKFAALLLLSALQPGTVPTGPVRHPRAAAHRVIADRLRVNPSWARRFQDDGGADRLTSEALDLLAGLDLAAVDATGLTLLPAAGRYRPTVADAPVTAPSTAPSDGADAALQTTIDDQPPAEEPT